MPSFTSPPDPKAFKFLVWEIVRQIPPGKVSAYGQIAVMIPPPGTLNLKDYTAFGPRWVGGAMAACPPDVPWQRVINAQGRISPRPGAELQRQLLEAEGVEFDERGKIDFDAFGWGGPNAGVVSGARVSPAAAVRQESTEIALVRPTLGGHMDITNFNPQQMDALRRAFKLLNRFMVWMWKLGLGRMINIWPAGFGRIMIIKHVGRKSGKERLAPVNYAIVDDEIYCTAGFGAVSDWYRNIMANPNVELWLPEGKFPARVEDVSNSHRRLHLLRQILIASGFAAPLFGISPKISDEKLAALSPEYRILHFIWE